MEEISSETLQSFCRTCLKKLKRQKCNIQKLDVQIRQWLEDDTIVNPLANDTYPNHICLQCRNKLRDFLEFRQMCARSRKKINDILENKEPVAELIKNPCDEEETIVNTSEDPKDIPHEPQIEQFLSIDMVTADDAECPIKSEPIKEDIDMEEEPLINTLIIKDEMKDAKIDSFNFINIDNTDDKHADSSDQDYDNSDSEYDLPIDDAHGNSLDGSKEDVLTDNETATKESKKTKPKIKQKWSNKYKYQYPCDQCKFRSVSQQLLDIHKRIHIGLKPYQCSECEDISFDKSEPLVKHLRRVHGLKGLNIICEHEDCAQTFHTTRTYKEHYRTNHIKEKRVKDKDAPTEKIVQQHVCEECGKIYTKMQLFKEHQYTHGPKELYPFQCKDCDKAFVKHRTYKEHQMRHAGVKNFECSYCGLKKTTKKELRTHLNTHTRAKKYPCPNCTMIFYRTSNLRVHVEVVHQGLRRFACRYCDQTFGKGDNLKQHEFLHTGEKPHECKECGRRFVQKVSLRSHMKTHNK